MSATILALRDVRLKRGAREVLRGCGFELARLANDRGMIVALMGPSGSGKTTLLRAIAGLEPFDAGSIVVGDVRLEGGAKPEADALRRLRRKVGFVFQFHHLFEHMSALDNVCLAPIHVHGIARPAAEARGRELLASLGVEHRAQALPRELSGGEAQRVAIARALAVDPPLLLMDEPTASLDPERRAELGALLRGLTSENRTILIATHDTDFARDWATQVLRVNEGRVGS